MERAHFYFLLEYLLQKSGYALFNLLSPVLTYDDCHHNSISYQLMGFMYFLLFEFMYYQRTYSGSLGRDALVKRMAIINYFVDIADREFDDFVLAEAGKDQDLHDQHVVGFYE